MLQYMISDKGSEERIEEASGGGGHPETAAAGGELCEPR